MINGFGFVETTVGPTGLLYTTTDDHIIVLNNQTGNVSSTDAKLKVCD